MTVINETAFRLSPQQARQLRLPGDRSTRVEMRLQRRYSAAAVEAAVEQVLCAHEIFRTKVQSTPKGRFQFVAEAPGHRIRIIEAGAVAPAHDAAAIEAHLQRSADGQVQGIELIAPEALLDVASAHVVARQIGQALRGQLQSPELQYADLFDIEDAETGVVHQIALSPPTRARLVDLTSCRESVEQVARRWTCSEEAVLLALSAALLDRLGVGRLQYVFDARREPELRSIPGRLDCMLRWSIPRANGMRLQGLAAFATRFLQDHATVEAALGAPAACMMDDSAVEVVRYAADPDVHVLPSEVPPPGAAPGLRWLDDGERLQLQVWHDPAALSDLSAALLASAVEPWLRAALGNLPLVGLGLHSHALQSWYRGLARERPEGVSGVRSLPDAVAHWAALTPDEPALHDADGSTWTYSQLHAQIVRSAARLREHGVRLGDRVGVAMARTDRHIAVLLAVMASGGIYVPIDARHPVERNRRIVADAGLACMIVDEPGLDLDVGELAAADVLRSGEGMGATPALIDLPENARAYIVFTSGTTGMPKGVVVSHAALCAYAHSLLQRVAAPDRARWAMLSTMSGDLGYTAVFGAFVGGGCYCVLPDRVMLDGTAAARALREQAVDILKIVPSHWLALSEQAIAAGEGPLRPRQALVFGGDRLDAATLAAAATHMPQVRVFNHYGPTETTVGVLATAIDGSDGPLGRPLAHVSACVLDAAGNLCLPGHAGEFAFSGPSVASGYWNRPAATAERFRPDPFSEIPGARMYLTGDHGVVDDDGVFHFHGRRDDQIKLSGQRVDLGEVQAALRIVTPDAVPVVVVDSRNSSKVLRGFLRSSMPIDGADAQARLHAHLPEHMVPASLHCVTAFPLLANGKIDRAELLLLADRELAGSLMDPQSPLQFRVRDIWAQLLDVSPRMIGLNSNFFRIGGHSLLAARMLARVQQEFGRAIPIRAFFEQATLAGFASLLEEGGSAAGITLRPQPPRVRYPLSLGQARLWSIAAAGQDDLAYNSTYLLRLRGQLDEGRMAQCLQDVQMRHQPIHSRIVADTDGVPWMEPMATPVDVSLIDLRGEGSPDAAVAHAVRALRDVPFRLDAGAPLRLALIRVDADEWLLLLVVHHVAWDGWSNAVFLAEVSDAYRGTPLPGLPVCYGDFALAEREDLERGALDVSLDYWQEHLAGLPTLDLRGVDYLAPRASFQGARVSRALPPDVVASLLACGQHAGTTAFMTGLAGWFVNLYRHSGQRDFAVGTSAANRTHPDLEGLVGFFVNQLVLRADLSGEPAFHELLQRVKTAVLAAFEHQAAPFGRVVSRLRHERQVGRQPLFQSMFVMQSAPPAGEPMPGITATIELSGVEHAKFDLTLYLQEHSPGAMAATLVFDRSLITASHAERIVEDFVATLAELLKTPDRPVSEVVRHLGDVRQESITSRKFQGLRTRSGATETGLAPTADGP